jgi:lipopolysaccharide transport system permease protein
MSAEPDRPESAAVLHDSGAGAPAGAARTPAHPSAAMGPAVRSVIVRARRGWALPDVAEAWHYRELFGVLALRDIKIRYKQTVLGVAWAVVQPFVTMVVFTMISRLGKISTEGVPPQVFYYCGMLPWLLFANALTSAGNSLVGSQHLITKVYFPRVIVPAAAVITALIDFAAAFVVLLVLMPAYRVAFVPQIVFLPAFVALAFLTALAFGLGLSALTVQFRDVRHIAPFFTQLWLFCTPVLYSSGAAEGWKRTLLALNPMSGVVEGFRWCVLGRPAPGPALAVSLGTDLVVLVTSLFYFHHVERTLADRL